MTEYMIALFFRLYRIENIKIYVTLVKSSYRVLCLAWTGNNVIMDMEARLIPGS